MLKLLSNNLNTLMSEARLNSSELARHIGIPAATIKRIRNNEQSNPTISTLLPIANYFSVSLNQLIGNESFNMHKKTNELFSIPLLSWQECIHFSVIDYKKMTDRIITERKMSDKAFALIVDSYDLNFFPKDSILIIEPETEIKTNDYVIVANCKNQIASIRRYIVEIDQIYLKPLVPGLEISALTPEYKILGAVLQYKVELK